MNRSTLSFRSLSLAGFFLALALPVSLSLAETETEFNDDFFSRNTLAPGVSVFTGELEFRDFEGGSGGFEPHFEQGPYSLYVKLGTSDPNDLVNAPVDPDPNLNTYNGAADIARLDAIDIGEVDFFSFSQTDLGASLIPGTSFVAVVDNDLDAESDPDLTIGWLEGPFEFSQIDTDDDSSPLGDGLAPTISGFVDGAGEIHLGISGFADFDFDGLDDDGGCDDEVCEMGDVDFVSFTGLTPGEFFFAELTTDDFDSLLGVFGDDGTPLAANDDFIGAGEIETSALGGLVPASGTLHFAVSGSGDNGFFGEHFEVGDYHLELSTAPLGDTGDLPIGDLVVLPEVIGDGEFFFDDVDVIEDRPISLDPDVAVGYEYEVDGGGIQFASVQLPALVGDTDFELSFMDGATVVEVALAAGDIFDFPAGGVAAFTVNGIDIGELLDPNDPIAFITVVTFTGTGQVDITQSAITSAIPEPAAVTLLGLGMLMVAGLRRRLG